ncbi:MAG TPA: hypothetical protein VL693_13985 [Vicinamibacterales bacterium]|jgi:hypothetical protein|nr:hypothetical protein [Vicinamibacterales bacterium]
MGTRGFTLWLGISLMGLSGALLAQATAPKGRTAVRAAKPIARTTSTPARGGVSIAPQAPVLAQLMQGILFPSSNVIFMAQHDEFAQIKPAADPTLATDPIQSVYGGWLAVENASLAIAEATNLLLLPGRKCSNGRPVPLADPDWPKYVAALRQTALASYKAAQTKDQDQILDAADKLAVACSHCHAVYRDKTAAQGGEANRCMKP